MKPKPIRLYFRVAMMLLMMLTTMTTWATTETRTVTFYMDGGASGNTSAQDDWTLVSSGKTLHWSNNDPDNNKISLNSNSKTTSFRTNVITCNGVIEFLNLEGTVKSVELTNFNFRSSGMQMYIGLNKNNTSTLLHLQGTTNDYDFPSNGTSNYSNSATFEGSVTVSKSNPLKIMFSSEVQDPSGGFVFKNGTIVITYDVDVEDTSDPGHTFTFSASGNTLTATCTQTSQYHNCNLGTSRKSTLTLTANDASYNGLKHSASLNLTDFSEETGITDIKTTFTYTNNATSESSGTAPNLIGDYTVTVTVIINSDNEHPYVLTTNFSILAGFNVNNTYSQFSLSKSSALEGETITITYTQQMDESLDGLTLRGATSGNNIAYTQSGNTYTFNMPAEDVNLSATFTYPLNEDNITQSGDTYTIKTAEGWNYFCQRLEVDGDLNGFSGKTVVLAGNITVTTMAGSTDHPFKGTFDGDGHTLTFNYTANMANCAPFRITDGATIRNLHATGSIEGGTWHYISGLVGSASGKLTIENCRVSTQISSTISGTAEHGGFVGFLSSQYNQCHITGCVFDGLIYNPNTWNQTYGCGGFVGGFSQYGYAILEDCLFIHGQYDNNNGKCELWWGNENDKNSTFLHRTNNQGEGTLKNCFYVGTRGLKQGSPAVESATAPTNFAHLGDPTDHCFMKTYGRLMVFNNKYYTPTYGDLVETYDYSGVKSFNIEYDDKPLGISDITTQLWAPLLRYKRTFTNGKPVTVMLPFNFTTNDLMLPGSYDHPTGKFYSFACINGSSPVMESTNEVTSMTANTPYIYVPGEDTEYWYIENSGYGISIFTEGYSGGTKEVEYDGWTLKGTYDGKIWDADASDEYVLGDDGKVALATAGTMVNPTSAYVLRNFDLHDLTLYDSESNSSTITAAATSGDTYDVTLSGRTLYKDGAWNTLCLPFDVTLEGSPLEGAVAKTLDLTNTVMSGTNVHIAFGEPVEVLTAGVPYIIKWESGNSIANPTFEDVAITAPTAQVLTSTDECTRFIGYYDAFDIDASDTDIFYMTADNTLKYTAKPRTLKAFRAYFQFSANGGSDVKALTFDMDFGDGDATGIELVESGELRDECEIYDLAGRRVSTPTKGLYIINGKKVFIK
ncbi:MAG: hypothetical protein Q4E32_04970 [Bacteroidales bacterium]|nr:hypothetical protein [Bacteroidales bacterium]